jgi:CRAL/TRIO domain
MKIVVLNSNYVTRLIYNAVGVFLSEKQRERVFFVDPANQLKFLENIIDRD